MFRETFTRGLWKNLPPFRLTLGLCPSLAVSTTAENALGMGLSTTFVLVFACLFISLLRRTIPGTVRLASFILIVATMGAIVEILLKAFFFPLSVALGIYIPLIVVNCIILGRAEAFASKNPPSLSLLDGLGVGLGFTTSLTLIGSIREILGAGQWFGVSVFPGWFEPLAFMAQAPGGFLALGLVLGLMNWISRKRGEVFVQG
ncbi:MAG: electron transport complex subunit RsxE [Gemmatimonadota bacterium]|nr:MAG: electron transport complex subunit RsxE [Gemmatimonadota bacterium]